LKQSDHKPVFGLLGIKIKRTHPEMMNTVLNSIYAQINASHQRFTPKLTLSTNAVNFESVLYKQSQKIVVQAENTGDYALSFGPRPIEGIKKPHGWLSYSPQHMSLGPGQRCSIELVVYFSEKHAKKVYQDPEYTKTILIISVMGGSDHFIEIACNLKPSCFGADLYDLSYIQDPVRFLPKPISAISKELESSSHSIPKELKRVLTFINEHHNKLCNLFIETGNKDAIRNIRDALDTGSDFPESCDVHSMCYILLEFLDSLQKPLVPLSILDPSVKMMNDKTPFHDASNHFISSMEGIYKVCFLFLTNQLAYLCQNNENLKPAELMKVLLDPLCQLTLQEVKVPEMDIANEDRRQFLGMFLL
jgi:hypothetical protein